MPDNPYPAWKRAACPHCAAGVPMYHYRSHGNQDNATACTAPTEAERIEELEQQIADLEEREECLEDDSEDRAELKAFRKLAWKAVNLMGLPGAQIDEVEAGIELLVEKNLALSSLETRVARWIETSLGPDHMHRCERAMRLLEEAMELAQSEGIESWRVTSLMRHVYGRPAGDPAREASGVAVCLLGWCAATGHTFAALALAEIERNEAKPVELIRESLARKQDAGLVMGELIHGQTCKKAAHIRSDGGYLHRSDDDTPYDVDGVRYCGRCHVAI